MIKDIVVNLSTADSEDVISDLAISVRTDSSLRRCGCRDLPVSSPRGPSTAGGTHHFRCDVGEDRKSVV